MQGGAGARERRQAGGGASGFGIGHDQEDEERYDALESHRLKDHPELRLVSFKAGESLSFFSGYHCPLP